MNKWMNHLLLTWVVMLLFSACLPVGSESVSTAAPSTAAAPPTPLGGSNPEHLSKYIGVVHPPLPAGLSEGFSMLIQGKEGYALWLVSENGNEMLWLSRVLHSDANGAVDWQVQDVLDLSTFEAGLMLLPDGCSQNGIPDSEIIVVSKDNTIQQAWRANATSGRFEYIPTTGIECLSDKAFGL